MRGLLHASLVSSLFSLVPFIQPSFSLSLSLNLLLSDNLLTRSSYYNLHLIQSTPMCLDYEVEDVATVGVTH